MSRKPRRRKPATTPTRKGLARLFLGLGTVGLVVAVAAVLIVVMVVGQKKTSEGPTVSPVAEVTPAGGDASYQGGPRMRFAVQAVDFGKVPLDVPVRYAFEFTNVGDATLQITDVDVKTLEGCCPFTPVVGSTTIKPGEKSEISLENFVMHAGMEGPHLFEITVRCNDPVESEHKLQVKALW